MAGERAKEFLLKLADLCEEYKATFEIFEDEVAPTISADGLSMSGIAYLGDERCPENLRKLASELK